MKKKVLFITYNLKLGGTNSTLYDMVALLDKEKYDITIFTLHDGGSWEPRFRSLGIPVLNSYGHMRDAETLFGRLGNRLELKKIEYMRKNQGKGLIGHCLKEKFDLAILHHSYEPFERTPFMPGTATIRYIHGDADNNERYRGVLEASSEYFKDYDKIVCVSQVAKASFNKLFGCEQQSVVCYNPLNTEEMLKKSMEKAEDIPDTPYICVVGRLAPEKGNIRLIHIHAGLVKDGLKHQLVIVGEGPERPGIEAAIRDEGVQDSVVMAGYQENPYPYIRNSLFTVCPSYSEGLHMASMESIALGVPVVAAVEPVRELFGEADCGLITGNDDQSLEAGIRKMLTDKAFYQLAVREAEKRGASFSGEEMIRNVEKIFDEVIASKETGKK